MKSYPYIGKGNYSGAVFLFIREGTALKMQRGESLHSNYETHISEGLCANITHEYLQNTYGEVVSPEHAEFIIELAKANNIEVCKSFRSGLFFNFYMRKDIDKLVLFFFHEDKAKEEGEKQITIPLPPKQIQTATPEEEFEMTQIMKNAGDNLVLGCEDSKCDKWPKIGDEVLIYSKFRRLAEIKGKAVKVIGKCNHSDGSTIITVEHSSLGVFAVAEGSWIKKPKTPEEELRDDIIDLTLSHMENKSHPIEANAYYLFSDLIDKYNITKKPQ